MRKMILVSVLALLAACGSSGNGVSVSTGGDEAPAATASGGSGTDDTSEGTADSSGDTISVENIGDMPSECLDLLSTFLKQIEPVVSGVDWEKATLADMQALGEQFQAESDTFDTKSAAAGCDKYNISGSDEKTFQQVIALAKSEAPGTVGFLNFLYSLTSTVDTTPDNGSVPGDCAGSIAAVEPYLGQGKTMQDLTMAELTEVSNLMTAIATNCSAEEANAFFTRDDVLAFVGGGS